MIRTCLCLIFLTSVALAHDHRRQDLGEWFRSLKSKSGTACCDNGDAEHAEAEWDTGRNGYRVYLRNPQTGQGWWYDVPDSAMIEGPNKEGIAMVWWTPTYSNGKIAVGADGRMAVNWRCFIAGGGI